MYIMNNKMNSLENNYEQTDLEIKSDESGFSYEEGNPASPIQEFEKPFKPSDIKIDVKPIPIERIISRIKRKELNLSPDFQRNEVWDEARKSRLIESLMLNIPLPIFYVSADENSIWRVVDGLQRLTAIKEFIIDKSYKLSHLEYWTQLDGKSIDEIPAIQYNQIMDSTFQFVIISPSTPKSVEQSIFRRVNTGGMPLSSQEIRHALYQGPGTEFLKKLSENEFFKKATDYSVKDLRMGAREIILRLFAFYLLGVENYPSNSDMDSFLCKALETLNSSEKEFDAIETKFKLAMNICVELFGRQSFRISLGKEYRTPVNKSLFEMLGFFFMKCREEEIEKVRQNKESLVERLSTLYKEPEFKNSVSQNSWKFSTVKYRFEKIQKIFEEVQIHA